MGIVSNAVMEGGGAVTGIVPFAIHVAGGEKQKTSDLPDTDKKNSQNEHGKVCSSGDF